MKQELKALLMKANVEELEREFAKQRGFSLEAGHERVSFRFDKKEVIVSWTITRGETIGIRNLAFELDELKALIGEAVGKKEN